MMLAMAMWCLLIRFEVIHHFILLLHCFRLSVIDLESEELKATNEQQELHEHALISSTMSTSESIFGRSTV